MAKRQVQLADKIDINMTPMIDIVFQLLAFFIMSLKIVEAEGDFDVRMPLGVAATPPDEQQVPPIKLKLTADEQGDIDKITMNGSPVAGFDELRSKILKFVGTDTGPNSIAEQTEAELDCDYGLKYENVVNAISAVSGRVENGEIIELVKKIKFAPPKKKKS